MSLLLLAVSPALPPSSRYYAQWVFLLSSRERRLLKTTSSLERPSSPSPLASHSIQCSAAWLQIPTPRRCMLLMFSFFPFLVTWLLLRFPGLVAVWLFSMYYLCVYRKLVPLSNPTYYLTTLDDVIVGMLMGLLVGKVGRWGGSTRVDPSIAYHIPTKRLSD